MLRSLFIILTLFIAIFAQPAFSFDITPPKDIPQPINSVKQAGSTFYNMLQAVITLVFTFAALAVLFFVVWGALEWIISGGDKESLAKAKKKITTALIGLLVLSLSFLLVTLVGKIVGIDFTNLPDLGSLGGS